MLSDWPKVRSERGILIYSARQGLKCQIMKVNAGRVLEKEAL